MVFLYNGFYILNFLFKVNHLHRIYVTYMDLTCYFIKYNEGCLIFAIGITRNLCYIPKGIIFKDTKTFVKKFKAAYKYDPDYHNASAIAEMAVYKNAIEKAGSLDPKKVRNAIAKTNIETVYGRVQFNSNGQIKGSSVVLQIQGGQVYQVYPKGSKKPIYPMPKWKTR